MGIDELIMWLVLLVAFAFCSYCIYLYIWDDKKFKNWVVLLTPSLQVKRIARAEEFRDVNSNLIGYKPKGSNYVIIRNGHDLSTKDGIMAVRISPHDGVYLPLKFNKTKYDMSNLINWVKHRPLTTTEETINALVGETPEWETNDATLESVSEQETVQSSAIAQVREVENTLRHSLTPKTLILLIVACGVAGGVICGGILWGATQGYIPLAEKQVEYQNLNLQISQNNRVVAEVFQESGLVDMVKEYIAMKTLALNQTMPPGG